MQGLPEIGDVLDGTYKVEKLIGTGGFGAVYLARQLSMDRKVALKILVANAMNVEEMIERFRREVMACRNLGHPNTIRIYDFRDRPDGILYYTMEYVNGPTLKDIIKEDGPLPEQRVAHILKQICKSLAEAHSFGIVHRDLKPANIMLADIAGETDFVKVVDFGIAKIVDDGSEDRDQLTNAGVLVGTLNYMSPEQIQGGEIGPVSDLYALGLIAIEMLMGQSVFAGTGRWEVLHKQISDEPVDIPDVVLKSAIGGVLQKTLKKTASERYASAEELLNALNSLNNLKDTPLIAVDNLPVADVEPASAAPTSGPHDIQANPVESEPPLPEPVRPNTGSMRTTTLDEPTGPEDAPVDEPFSEAPTSLHDSGVSPNPLHDTGSQPQQPAVQTPDRQPMVSPISGQHTMQQADRQPRISPLPNQGFAPGDTDMGPAPTSNKGLIAVAAILVILVVVGIGIATQLGGDDPVEPTDGPITPTKVSDPVANAEPTPPELDNIIEELPTQDAEPEAKAVPTKTVRLLTPGVKAQVFEGEELIGETPLRFPVGAEKTFTLKAEGYEEQSVSLSNQSDEIVDIRLQRISVASKDPKPKSNDKPKTEDKPKSNDKPKVEDKPKVTDKPKGDDGWVDIKKEDKPKSDVPVF